MAYDESWQQAEANRHLAQWMASRAQAYGEVPGYRGFKAALMGFSSRTAMASGLFYYPNHQSTAAEGYRPAEVVVTGSRVTINTPPSGAMAAP